MEKRLGTEPNYRYKAFISYSHRDEKWASWLHKAIETYSVPRYLVGQHTAMGVIPVRTSPVFRDRDELASATDLGAKLREALEGSACLLVICSPASANSHWVNEEILSFKRLGRADRIFALIVGGEPYASGMPGRERDECFPPALRYQLGADGELSDVPAEPIAADAREGKDGKSNAQIKLLAGMLGVGFDALRQRELQRRQRRLALITSASVVGMLIAIGLATTALIARNEAERQRGRAEKEAETARQLSSFMVSLFSVSDPSEARGKSITAREILQSGAQRIDSELRGEPAVQAELMDTIGTVYAGLGLYDDASSMLERSLAKRRTLDGIDAGVIARNKVRLADVFTEKADFGNAEKLYLEAIAALEPRQAERAAAEELASALAGLAEVHYQAGRYPEAEPILKRVLELRRTTSPPGDASIADAMEQLGLNQWDQGNMERAEELLRESLTMRRTALGDAPHPDTARHLTNLAALLIDLKHYDESNALFHEALEIHFALYGKSHPEIATVLNNLGYVSRLKGDLAQAKENYQAALEMQRQLLGEAHPSVAVALENLAFVLFDEAKLDAAVSTEREALEIRRKALGEQHVNTANSMATLARWLADSGVIPEAEKLGREALAVLMAQPEPDNEDVARAQLSLAQVLMYTPALEEARSLAEGGTVRIAAALGEDDWMVAYGNCIRGGTLTKLGRYEEAEALLVPGVATLASGAAASPGYIRKTRELLAELYERTGRSALARQVLAQQQPAPSAD